MQLNYKPTSSTKNKSKDKTIVTGRVGEAFKVSPLPLWHEQCKDTPYYYLTFLIQSHYFALLRPQSLSSSLSAGKPPSLPATCVHAQASWSGKQLGRAGSGG